MLPEIAHVALILAFGVAIMQAVIPLIGVLGNHQVCLTAARPLAFCQFFFLVLSFIGLAIAFLTNDFSVAYVFNHSNTQLPNIYKFSAIWGSHEGSMLLWVLILSGWTFVVSIFSRQLPVNIIASVIAVLGIISIFFIAFTLFTSNPFLRYLPLSPAEGQDLNPLLQDFGLVIHPPMLYLGYVGFSVPFAYAIAGLINGRLDAQWVRWLKPWVNIAWLCLTIGIILGSWWAYYELGWGGWWFWDPVENASFMPWLVGTALIHSLNVTEKRDTLKNWTVLLAIITFAFSLIGTFLVRSGVLNSVHAFANDPERGQFILSIVITLVGSSLFLYAWRARAVTSHVVFSVISRETFLLINNMLLIIITLFILLGTLYPLIMEALDLGEVSVDAPYFNIFFVPIVLVMGVLIGIGPFTTWRETSIRYLSKQLWHPALISIVIGALFPIIYAGEFNITVSLGVTVAAWIVLSSLWNVVGKINHRLANVAVVLRQQPPSYYGMLLAHIGLAISMFGVCITANYSIEKDVRLEVGEQVKVGGYTFIFTEMNRLQGPNYVADQGVFIVKYDDVKITNMLPEKRLYTARNSIMTEAAIDPGITRDLYVVLGEYLNPAWTVRIHYKPFIRCIWLGGIIMALGALIAVGDRRFRKTREKSLSTNN